MRLASPGAAVVEPFDERPQKKGSREAKCDLVIVKDIDNLPIDELEMTRCIQQQAAAKNIPVRSTEWLAQVQIRIPLFLFWSTASEFARQSAVLQHAVSESISIE